MVESLTLKELCATVNQVSHYQYDAFLRALVSAADKRLFVYGSGRSGLSAEMGAMRLMHLGIYKSVHFIGEATCPSVSEDDVVMLVSASGETRSTNYFASIAVACQARVVTVTGRPDSSLQTLSTCTLLLPSVNSQQFGGTVFEESALVIIDSLAGDLRTHFGVQMEVMRKHHTNFE